MGALGSRPNASSPASDAMHVKAVFRARGFDRFVMREEHGLHVDVSDGALHSADPTRTQVGTVLEVGGALGEIAVRGGRLIVASWGCPCCAIA